MLKQFILPVYYSLWTETSYQQPVSRDTAYKCLIGFMSLFISPGSFNMNCLCVIGGLILMSHSEFTCCVRDQTEDFLTEAH